MLDPALIRLNETLHRERLHEAAEARHQQVTGVAAPSPLVLALQAIGTWLSNLGQRLQAPARNVTKPFEQAG